MISKKYKEIIKNLEENIDSKRDLEYAKKQISDLTVLYIDELSKIEEKLENKVKKVESRVDDLEENMRKIEEEVCDEFEDESMLDLEPITCPYCDFKFMIEFDSSNTEIKCPECDNIIELDWDEGDI